MAENDDPKVRVLDPVVVEALKAITRRVYHRRRPQLWGRFRRYFSMLDNESRDSFIATFEHLRHGGYEFPAFLVRRWAIANGSKKLDAQLLDDYAAGVLAGVLYHHADPVGRNALEAWRHDAAGKPPWVNPGRPGLGIPFTRNE